MDEIIKFSTKFGNMITNVLNIYISYNIKL